MGKKDKAVDAVVKEDAEVMTTQDEGVIPNVPETQDEKINKVGTDVPTVPKPKTKPKPKKVEVVEPSMAQLRGAIVYLVKSVMTPADIEDFKKLFPGLM